MKKNLLLNLIPAANREEFLAAAKAMREDTRTWNIVRRGEVLATVKCLQKAEETRKAIAENNEWAITEMDIVEAK